MFFDRFEYQFNLLFNEKLREFIDGFKKQEDEIVVEPKNIKSVDDLPFKSNKEKSTGK